MLNLYITSINKNEGKTFLSAGLAATMQSLGYATSVYKPIQTGGKDFNGFMQSPDLTFISSVDPYIKTQFSYLFKSNAEPLIAAENENKCIELTTILKDYQKIISDSDCTIIDGDSGLFSPLAPNLQTNDLIKHLQTPVVIVINPEENIINNTLVTIYSAQEKGINIRGIVINNITDNCSAELLTSITRIIEEYTNVKILGLIPHIEGKIAPEELITGILNGVDIESIFNVKIEKLDFN